MVRDIKRILYTPPRGIGDIMFSLPLLHSLREAYPEAEIYVPMPKDKEAVVGLVGFLKMTKKYLPKPSEDTLAWDRWQASLKGDKREKYRLEKLIYEKYLAGENFDMALIPKDFRIDGLDCPVQICDIDLARKGLVGEHMVDRFLGFADYLGIEKKLEFGLGFDKSGKVMGRNGELNFKTPYIVLNLGASLDKKVWSAQGYSDIALWGVNNGLGVVLTGDKESFGIASSIECKNKKVINAVSNNGYFFNLENLGRLAFQSEAFVSPDTGVLHLADAVGSNVIGLYGPTSPVKFGPYNNRDRVVSRFGIDKNVKNIKPEEVIKRLQEVVLS